MHRCIWALLSFNHNLEEIKNTTHIENVLSLMHLHLFSLLQKKVYFSLYYEKNRVLLKTGCFIGPQNQWFQLKKMCFFRPKSAKRGCFSNLGTSVVYALVGTGGGGGGGGGGLTPGFNGLGKDNCKERRETLKCGIWCVLYSRFGSNIMTAAALALHAYHCLCVMEWCRVSHEEGFQLPVSLHGMEKIQNTRICISSNKSLHVDVRTHEWPRGRTVGTFGEFWICLMIFYSSYVNAKCNIMLQYSKPHIMMTSSNGTIFRVTGPLCGEFTGPGEFPAQRPVTRRFDVFFDLRLNKRLSKQSWGWWFETLHWSLWRQCNGGVAIVFHEVHFIYWEHLKGGVSLLISNSLYERSIIRVCSIEFIDMFCMYIRYEIARHIHRRIIPVLTQRPSVSMCISKMPKI